MTDAHSLLQATLKQHQQSYTTARRLVFDALLQQGAQTMASLVAHCEPRIDRASVYRTTKLFEELGIIQRLQSGWKYRIELSDQFQPHHHHMYCTACGATIELPEDDQLEAQLHGLAAAQGFEPVDHQIEIRGICAGCHAPAGAQRVATKAG